MYSADADQKRVSAERHGVTWSNSKRDEEEGDHEHREKPTSRISVADGRHGCRDLRGVIEPVERFLNDAMNSFFHLSVMIVALAGILIYWNWQLVLVTLVSTSLFFRAYPVRLSIEHRIPPVWNTILYSGGLNRRMLNICLSCGDLSLDKTVRTETRDGDVAVATCPACENEYRFQYRSLLSLTGAPGAGKSTVLRHLAERVEPLVIESDVLNEVQHKTGMEWAAYCQLWLRVGMLLHHAGQRALIVGSGIGFLPNVARCDERRYFPTIERCALVADRDVLADRLQTRSWLQDNPEKREEYLETNAWFRDHGPEHDITLVDTTNVKVEHTVATVEAWVEDVTRPF